MPAPLDYTGLVDFLLLKKNDWLKKWSNFASAVDSSRVQGPRNAPVPLQTVPATPLQPVVLAQSQNLLNPTNLQSSSMYATPSATPAPRTPRPETMVNPETERQYFGRPIVGADYTTPHRAEGAPSLVRPAEAVNANNYSQWVKYWNDSAKNPQQVVPVNAASAVKPTLTWAEKNRIRQEQKAKRGG